ncbi:MAG: AAA family ATPase [Campylobacteraceae bacterium]|jgi:ATP-dependent exoDNAse (exonuclease V) alpha subunit|nr:AAA family ATPase [Campylobacteraceae bacterium]
MKELKIVKEILKNDHLFLTGGGGVGKSYLTAKLIEDYRAEEKRVVILGSTGISAVNIGGQTIHSFFAFGICQNTEELLRHDRYNKQRIKEINGILLNADLIIIDEISMVSAALMEMIRYRLENAKFKGSIMFVGDFFQLPPIEKNIGNVSLFGDEVYAFESSAWKNYNPKILELTCSKRTGDTDFFAILNKIRKGELNSQIIGFLENLRQNSGVFEQNPTILFGTNYEADRTNRAKLEEINEKLYVINADETIHEKTINVNKLQSWHKSLNIPLKLELKIGANVIFCANKWGKYFNGEQGIIRDIGESFLIVEKNDRLIKVEPHEYVLYENVLDGSKTLATLRQFSLKLSYAITIHKSQGMSIKNLVCDINNIFERSQFYVAISRAMSAKGLCIRYSRSDFEAYLKKCVYVDEKVKDFYKNREILTLKN